MSKLSIEDRLGSIGDIFIDSKVRDKVVKIVTKRSDLMFVLVASSRRANRVGVQLN